MGTTRGWVQEGDGQRGRPGCPLGKFCTWVASAPCADAASTCVEDVPFALMISFVDAQLWTMLPLTVLPLLINF